LTGDKATQVPKSY